MGEKEAGMISDGFEQVIDGCFCITGRGAFNAFPVKLHSAFRNTCEVGMYNAGFLLILWLLPQPEIDHIHLRAGIPWDRDIDLLRFRFEVAVRVYLQGICSVAEPAYYEPSGIVGAGRNLSPGSRQTKAYAVIKRT